MFVKKRKRNSLYTIDRLIYIWGGGYVRGCIYSEEYLSKQIDALVSGGLISGGYITGGLISGGHITGGLCPGGLYPGDFNVGFFGM